jgi:hypothetical protein
MIPDPFLCLTGYMEASLDGIFCMPPPVSLNSTTAGFSLGTECYYNKYKNVHNISEVTV